MSVHRAQKEKNGDWVRFKDRTWSLYRISMGSGNDLDVVGAISYDWRKKYRPQIKRLITTNKMPLTGNHISNIH